MRRYSAAINLKHFPAKTAQVCSDHFDNDCFVFDVLHAVALYLYAKYKTLKSGAVPTKFGHKAAVKHRPVSISRKRKHESDEARGLMLLLLILHAITVIQSFETKE